VTSLLGVLVPAPRAAIDRPRNAAPVPLTAAGGPGWSPFRGTGADKQLHAMGGVGTLYSVVNRITTATAAVDWHLWRKAKSGLDEDRTEVTSHACIDLWQQPNKHYTRTQLMETSGQHFELTGEAPILISRGSSFRSLPLELWPVRPDRIEPVEDPKEFITGYTYHSPDGQKLPLELDDVLRLLTPCPWDPYRGLGVVQTILVELESSRATAEWNRNFFRNSARPGGAIEYAEFLDDEDFRRVQAHWRDWHQGVGNAHRIALIEGGRWVDSKFSLRDLQFTELRKAGRDTILEGWGLHKASLGITDDVNRAASTAAKALFAEDITVPRLKRWRDLLNTRLLPMYGKEAAAKLEWDFENPVPPDAEALDRERDSKTKAWANLMGAGADPDEAADAVGLPRGLVTVQTPAPTPGKDPTSTPGEPRATTRELSLVEMVQKIYLGVGTVITWREAREILNRFGAELDLNEPAPTPRAPTTAAAAASLRGRRNLTGWLAAVRAATPATPDEPPPGWPAEDPNAVDDVDLGPVQAAWLAALGALLADWAGRVVPDWISSLAEQVRRIISGGGQFAGMTVDTVEAGDLVADAMADMAEAAARHVADDVTSVDLTAEWPGRAAMVADATATVDLLARLYELSAGREALRIAGPDADPDEVAARVTEHLEALSDAQPEQELGRALTGAQNAGRTQTLGSGPVGALYASEQMDSNTCGPCRAIHGRWICNTDDQGPLYVLYPTAGYVDCLGRQRCRGTVVGVWRPGRKDGNDG
jgi:HK97 family phage portal protein